MRYPAYGVHASGAALSGRQPFVVPAGEAVRFNLTSADVIHAFWIPALRYKHDADPRVDAGRDADVLEGLSSRGSARSSAGCAMPTWCSSSMR